MEEKINLILEYILANESYQHYKLSYSNSIRERHSTPVAIAQLEEEFIQAGRRVDSILGKMRSMLNDN